MDGIQHLDERLCALEEEVRRQQMLFAQSQGMAFDRTAPDLLERHAGTFADDPTFAEAVRLGREWRNTEAVKATDGDEGEGERSSE